MRTRNLTLLLSDVKGYTERQSRSSRKEIEAELVRHRSLLTPLFEAFGGRIVKTMGDAFLVAFESPTDAVHAAVQVQRALATENAKLADPAAATHVRVAISTGEVTVDEHGDVFGEPVNLAARLEGIAEAGTIYLTETTFLSMNRNEIPALEVGHRVFKGIPEEVKVFRILDAYVAQARLLSPEEIRRIAHASAPSPVAANATARGRGLLLAVLGALLVVGGGVAALLLLRSDPPAPAAAAPLSLERLVADLAAGAAKDPKQAMATAALLRRGIEKMAKEGQWDEARALAKRAADAVPDLPGPRDFWIDLSRMQLEDAVEKGTVDAFVRADPPAWYEANVRAPYERLKDVPRYRWLRATWFLALDPAAATTVDLVEGAVRDNEAARQSGALRTLLAGAVAATVGDERLHGRYQELLARVERAAAGTTPAPGGRMGTGARKPGGAGPGMRDR